jgi:hypothetical protein
MILKVGGGDNGHEQDLTIGGLGQAMIVVAEGGQHIGNDDKSGYNTSVVHKWPPYTTGVSNVLSRSVSDATCGRKLAIKVLCQFRDALSWHH